MHVEEEAAARVGVACPVTLAPHSGVPFPCFCIV